MALAKLGVAVGGEEIPGIGPIIAGAFSAYSLWTKNWKETGETIAAIDTGDGYLREAREHARGRSPRSSTSSSTC